MDPDGRDLDIPLETGRVTWRLVLGLALALLCVVDVASVVGSSHPEADDSMPVVLFLFGIPAASLLLSGVALRYRWQPNLLFRLLPVIVCVAIGAVALWLVLRAPVPMAWATRLVPPRVLRVGSDRERSFDRPRRHATARRDARTSQAAA
jgi:hypothetical protein